MVQEDPIKVGENDGLKQEKRSSQGMLVD